jgi:hypothetical protein
MAKPLKSHGKDYTLDMLLRVLESQQQMIEVLDGENCRWDERAKAIDLRHEIVLSVRWATKAMADLAGIRWAQSDADMVMDKGREGLEALATRYECRFLLGGPPENKNGLPQLSEKSGEGYNVFR